MQCASSGSSHGEAARSLQAGDDGKQVQFNGDGDLEQPLLLPPTSEEAVLWPHTDALAVLLRGQGRERGSLAGCLSLDCLSALDYKQPDQQASLLTGKTDACIATVHQDGWMKHGPPPPSAASCQEGGCISSNRDLPQPAALREVHDEPPTGAIIMSQEAHNCSATSRPSDDLVDTTESSSDRLHPLDDAAPDPNQAPAKTRRSCGQTITRFLMGSVAGTLSGVMAGLTVGRECATVPFPLAVVVKPPLFPSCSPSSYNPFRCASVGISMKCVADQPSEQAPLPCPPPQGIDGPPVILMFHLLHVPKDVARGSNAVINLLLMPWLLVSFAFMGVLHRRDLPLFAVAAAVSLFARYWLAA